MLATFHQGTQDGVALRREAMAALAKPTHDLVYPVRRSLCRLWRMNRHKY
jgi:hypothetical protein